MTEDLDPQHGPRGAELAEQLHRHGLLHLAEEPLQLLLIACLVHTAALTHEGVTVRTCFDVDRLDLARIAKTVTPDLSLHRGRQESNHHRLGNRKRCNRIRSGQYPLPNLARRAIPSLFWRAFALTLPLCHILLFGRDDKKETLLKRQTVVTHQYSR